MPNDGISSFNAPVTSLNIATGIKMIKIRTGVIIGTNPPVVSFLNTGIKIVGLAKVVVNLSKEVITLLTATPIKVIKSITGPRNPTSLIPDEMTPKPIFVTMSLGLKIKFMTKTIGLRTNLIMVATTPKGAIILVSFFGIDTKLNIILEIADKTFNVSGTTKIDFRIRQAVVTKSIIGKGPRIIGTTTIIRNTVGAIKNKPKKNLIF